MNGKEAGRGGRRRDAARRGQNGRPHRWADSAADDFGSPFEPQEEWIAQNGHSDAAASSGAVSTEDDASLERHTLKLATEVAKMQEELEHYRKILAERAEVRRLKAELASSEEAAEKAREFQAATVTHLQDKAAELERENERMKARILEFLSASKGAESQLQEQARALEANAAKARQLEAAGSEAGGKIQALSARLRDLELWNEQLKGEKLEAGRNLHSAANALTAKSTEAEDLRAQLAQARLEGGQYGAPPSAELEMLAQRQAADIAMLQEQLRGMQAPRPPHPEPHARHHDAAPRAEPAPGLPMEEPALLSLVASLLPLDPSRPMSLPALVRELRARGVHWDRDYLPAHGKLGVFLAAFPRHFGRLPGSQAIYSLGLPGPSFTGKLPGPPAEQPPLPPPGARFVVTPQLPEVLARRAAQRGQQAERPGEAPPGGSGPGPARPAQQPAGRPPASAKASLAQQAAAAAPPGMQKEAGAAGQQAKQAQGAQQQPPPGLGPGASAGPTANPNSTSGSAGSSLAEVRPHASGDGAGPAGESKRTKRSKMNRERRDNKRQAANAAAATVSQAPIAA